MKNERKKILYVITKSNYGGAQRYVHELAVAAKKSGHTVAIACGGDGLLVERLQKDGIQTYIIPSLVRDLGFLKEMRAFFELRNICKEYGAEIVHLNSSKVGVLGSIAARSVRISKIIFTVHGWPFLEARNPIWRFIAWSGSYLTTLFAHTTIVVSMHDLTRARMPFVHHKIICIKTAVEQIVFLPKKEARDTLLSPVIQKEHTDDIWLTTTAELTSNKNLHTAIDAVLAHNKTNTKKIFYTILGDGELLKTLTTHIQEQNAQGDILLLGYVEDARKYLRAFDIFLLPSQKEGLPYALLEAGAAGLPAVASAVGGIPEVIEHNRTGTLVDPYATQEIVEALRAYSENETLRTQHGNALHEKVLREYALDTMLRKTMSLYTT